MDQENNNNPAQSRVETVVCGNCGKALRVRMPSKPGRYKFACTHCQNKVSFEVKASAERKVLKSDALDDRVISHDLPEDLKHKMAAPTPAVVKSASYVDIPGSSHSASRQSTLPNHGEGRSKHAIPLRVSRMQQEYRDYASSRWQVD